MKATDPGLRAVTESWVGVYTQVLKSQPFHPSVLARLNPVPRLEVLVEAHEPLEEVARPEHAAGAPDRRGFANKHLRVLAQLLQALQFVHAQGWVHRDVKPGNLMLDSTGTGRPHILLSDFGIAVRVQDARLTRTGTVVGTPGYLPPEAYELTDPNPAQDLYAAGIDEQITAVETLDRIIARPRVQKPGLAFAGSTARQAVAEVGSTG